MNITPKQNLIRIALLPVIRDANMAERLGRVKPTTKRTNGYYVGTQKILSVKEALLFKKIYFNI